MPIANEDKFQRGAGQVRVLEKSRSAPDIHGLDTARIVELFEGFGYACKPAAQYRGISGVLHDFDFVCTNRETGEKVILQSFLHMGDDPNRIDIEVVKLRLSTYDCSPDVSLIIINSFAKQVKQVAGLYRLTVIDASSGQNPYDQIESLLRLQAER